MQEPRTFADFAEGDVATFDKSFRAEDFVAFSELSGDRNPLHHDPGYASQTQFGDTIVPLHMTLAPLSAIAGMIFPGKPSLYLSHEVRAAAAVRYGETLRYSARIERVNAAQRILTLRVLALRGVEVVLDAAMRVQAIASEWSSESSVPIMRSGEPRRALVTGASGAIGAAVAEAFAAKGWKLLLQARCDIDTPALQALLARHPGEVEIVSADLATAEGRAALAAAASCHPDLDTVVHAASAGLDAPAEQLVATNYLALRDVAASVLPGLLARQQGRLIFVGSTAMIRAMPGWEDYSAAKAMTAAYLGALDARFAGYGVRGLTIAPGYVLSAFSDSIRGDAPALLPQEVAEAIVDMALDPGNPVVVLEPGRRSDGAYGFHQPATAGGRREAATESPKRDRAATGDDAGESIGNDPVAAVVRRVLRLPADQDLSGAGLGITPGWDSLRQIELLLELEASLGISFTAAEITGLTRFADLEAAVSQKSRGH